jgi:hypothetical protein
LPGGHASLHDDEPDDENLPEPHWVNVSSALLYLPAAHSAHAFTVTVAELPPETWYENSVAPYWPLAGHFTTHEVAKKLTPVTKLLP